MKTKKLAIGIVSFLLLYCFASAWAESIPLNCGEKQRLLNALKENPPYYSIDVTCEIRNIIPGDMAQENIEIQENRAKILGEKYNWGTTKFKPIGFFDSNGEYVVLTKERAKVEGAMRIRKDITYFSGESATAVSREITNIYNNGVFYFVNKGNKDIKISGKPNFESTSPLHFITCGKLIYNMDIVRDIVKIADPNYEQKKAGVNRKKFLDKGSVQINNSLAKQIECFNVDKSQKEYILFLDPNDWGICHKIVWYDVESGQVSKMSEFKKFSIVRESNDLYPHTIIHTYFDKEGKEGKKEIINIFQVRTNPAVVDESFQIKTEEFENYEITDYRLSPPLKTLNSLE